MRIRCFVIALAFLATIASDSWGQSKQPPPSSGKGIQPPNAQTTQSNNNPAADLRGSEQSPLVVKVLPTQEGAEKAAADTKREDQKTTNDERVARFTERLFWATVALSVIAGFQLFVFGWQGIQLQRSVSAAKEATDLASREFIAAHRPELKIHFIRLLRFESSEPPDRQPLRAAVGIINIGTSAGTVTGSAAYLEYLFPVDRPYLPDLIRNDIIIPRRFHIGATDSFTVSGDHASGLMHVDGAAEAGKVLYLLGWIVYQDSLENPRTTYFCRQYDPTTKRFTPVDDPDCNCTH